MKRRQLLFIFVIISFCNFICGAQNSKSQNSREESWARTNLSANDELKIWQRSYPDVSFKLTWDEKQNDWKLTVGNYGKTRDFYWCQGKYLPLEEIKNQDRYWKVITPYRNSVINPADFTPEQIAQIRDFGSSRATGRISSKSIFTAIYDSSSRRSTEQHIKQIEFLGKKTSVHQYLQPSLERIEKKILSRAKFDSEVKQFVDTLYSADAYNWRAIRDVNTRSFHSFGIAIDILPTGWGNKIVYWGFEKNNGNKDWMLIPLEKRWMPPKAVIDIFFEEGYIWGGTWAIWDNMHFEYHPELVNASKQLNLSR